MKQVYVITVNDGGITDLLGAYLTEYAARDAFAALLWDDYGVVLDEDNEDESGEWDVDIYRMTADDGQIYIQVESVPVVQ